MAISRYRNATIIRRDNKRFTLSSHIGPRIKALIDAKQLPFEVFTLSQGQRLDIVSANYYGDPSYWWVIAAASGIGWQCQVPAGTVLKIPQSLDQVARISGY